MEYQVKINFLQQAIINLRQNGFENMGFIIIRISLLFSEVKDTIFSDIFLPQIESLIILLESKTHKTFENMITDLNTFCLTTD